MYGFSQHFFLKNLLPYPDNRKKNTPGLYTDKSSIIEPLSFLSFKKGMTVEIHKQFIFTKRKCISPQTFSSKYKKWMFNYHHVWSSFTPNWIYSRIMNWKLLRYGTLNIPIRQKWQVNTLSIYIIFLNTWFKWSKYVCFSHLGKIKVTEDPIGYHFIPVQ